jgi:hypothetical protein
LTVGNLEVGKTARRQPRLTRARSRGSLALCFESEGRQQVTKVDGGKPIRTNVYKLRFFIDRTFFEGKGVKDLNKQPVKTVSLRVVFLSTSALHGLYIKRSR